MRRHYESLNYADAAPGLRNLFRFTRTQGHDGYLSSAEGSRLMSFEVGMDRQQTVLLRDMLNEVLADWQE